MSQPAPECLSEAFFPSPYGLLRLNFIEGRLACLEFLPQAPPSSTLLENSIQQAAAEELRAYFSDPRHCFSLPLYIQGTSFQKSVWQALRQIPCGQTSTYQALAQQLKTSPRAIGQACRCNPLAIIIPCHRVVSKTGLGGYCGTMSGEIMNIKKALLEHEARFC